MRYVLASAFVATALIAAPAASAEKRIFIISNNSSGYGVDRCLASGAACGKAAAAAYCQSQRFAQANSFRKLDPDEITGAVPTSTPNCRGGACVEEYVAIECQR
jgi:hypothetical protein